MTTIVATGVALLLYAVPFAILALATSHGRVRPLTIAGLAGSIAGIAFFQTGLLQRRDLASTDVAALMAEDPLAGRCEQVIKLLLDNRVVLAPPTTDELVVSDSVWDQVPPEIQEAVRACARDSSGENGAGDLPEVIRR